MNTMYDDFIETSDLDQDIQKRKELIEKAKAINFDGDEKEIIKEISSLRRQWKRIPYWESAYEETMLQEFEDCLDVFFAKRREEYRHNKEAKEELIQQAKEAARSTKLNDATKKMSDLMGQWKEVKSAGRDEDEKLWEMFNQTRQEFYQRKEKHWEDLQKKFAHAKEVKEKLIEEAKGLVDSENLKETNLKFQAMMEQWKSVGSAGKDFEEGLWESFNELRQDFYNRQNEYYHHVKEVEDDHLSKKKQLIKEAEEILNAKRFTKEDSAQMKQLGVNWKEIGFSGRKNEEKVWKEFRSIMDRYFDGLKENNELRHQQWRQRLLDTRARKQELIASQKNQLKRMQESMVGLISERAVNELQEDMEDKKEFIQKLESEMEDLDKKLAQ